jgi:three-Cys-motif partner protein
LDRVRKYLVAYSSIMQKRKFRYAYIDGFAGTGYHELKADEGESGSLFAELDEPAVEFLDGSARIALQVVPRFHKYIFIEKSRRKTVELERLRGEFPDKADDILIENAEANSFLQTLCLERSWVERRAVLFIDPFGM